MKTLIHLLTILIVLFSLPVFASEEKSLSYKNLLNSVSENYENGYCDQRDAEKLYSPNIQNEMILLALDDVLGFSLGRNSLTKEWIGNARVFKITHQLNPSFVALSEYAEREDIATQIEADLKEIRKMTGEAQSFLSNPIKHNPKLEAAVNAILQKTKQPMASLTIEEAVNEISILMMKPMACAIYEMTSIEQSAGGQVIAEYLMSLSKSALHRNIEKFNESMRDLE